MREFVVKVTQPQREKALEFSKLLETKQVKTLNLKETDYRGSKEPILNNCKCYACKHYNRGYLYHLLEVDEMNANILIGM